ncbi:MAG: DUF6240 domain-containing protein [Butyrivibrio sp.]|nr:DUF6240 domain-containing protein [Acetatifactor muris]MCM1559522.1 DUF6240 domain-containing protein [Butyrivibrio sp.]
MRISFNQQSVGETEKRQAESHAIHSKGISGKNAPGKVQSGVSEAGVYVPGGNWGGMPGNGPEKGKSLIEIQQEAQNTDVGISQDYMTVMSHTLSEEDYAKAQEEGFDFGSMNPEETVTIVDKIKAELVRAGKNVAGYTDDMDMAALAAALGSQALAEAVSRSFREADLPLTEENLERVETAWLMASQLQPLEQGSIRYLIDNEMDSEVWNLYVAENSGAAAGTPRGTEEIIPEGELARQMDGIIENSGRQVNEESREDAAWLLENGLPLTEENLDRLDELKKLEMPVTPERFAEAAAGAVAEGKAPIYGTLSGKTENIYEKAVRVEAYYQSSEVWEEYAGDVTARRQLEEIRLRMTAEVNVKLLKSGFSIDTAPMEKLVEALRQAEEQLAAQYFPEDAESLEKYRNFRDTDTVLRELPGLPADVLGVFAEGQSRENPAGVPGEGQNPERLGDFHREGKVLQDTYRKAGESYEALMTEPRRDLGDSIKKAFANVDDILEDLGQELTDENRRAVRILGYNRMEMNLENLEKVKEADRVVQTVVEKLTPAATLKMIRDGVNPLEKTFDELEQYFRELPEDYRQASESYSRFLYGLEKKHAVTSEERESYIGIYRLVRQIEKTDGAAVGALVNTQAELHFANLLSAVRSGRFKTLDARVGDKLGNLVERIQKGESISEQIAKAFGEAAKEVVTEVSYSAESEQAHNKEQLEQYRMALASADRECAAMLQRGELPVGADNLLAAAGLLEEDENLFAEGDGEEPETELWESLDRPEEFEKNYEAGIARAKERVEEATFRSADSSLDVRHMQLTHKQLTIAGNLAKQQEFFLPLNIGGRLTRVHLTFERGGESAGRVEISVKAGEEQRIGIKAAFRFEDGSLSGIIKNETENEVMKTERIADIFKEEAGENWKMGDVSVVTTDVRFPEGTGMGMDAGTENAELYRVAKVFLHAVQEQEGVLHAN